MTRAPSPRLVTSDVFDTALLRLVGRPRSAFLLLGERLRLAGLWRWDARVFAIQRAQAEATAAASEPGADPSLADIYRVLVRGPFLVDPDRAARMELDLERQLLTPARGHAALLDRHRAAGARVAFVSDTYLSSAFVREVLGDLVHDDEAVHTSCEAGRSKHVGTLFAHVLEQEAEAPDGVLHVGDDDHADRAMAVRAGLAAAPVAVPTLNRYETVLERHAVDTNGVSSLLAGASRVARASRPEDPHPARHAVAASVGAPVLIGFVSWTLEAARAAGCDRIGYVSRDGQILEQIAIRLEAHRAVGDRVSTRYVHGGRRAWHPAGLTAGALAGDPPAWWLEEARRGRWQAPLDILGLDADTVPAAFAGALQELWARPADDEPWPQVVARRQEGLRQVWHDAAVQAVLAAAGEQSRSRLTRYLQEQGLGAGRWALVDVGWRGYSAASLNRALVDADLTVPLHLYLGLREPDPELTRRGDWQSYLFCQPGPDHALGGLGGALTTFIEVLCSADHGSVAGFREGPTGVEPVLDPPHTAAAAWGIDEVQAVILDIADALAPFANELAATNPRAALAELLQLFLGDPDRAEVEAWSSFPFTDDPAGKTATPWVAQWSTKDLLRWAARGHEPRSFWPEASLALGAPAARALVAARRRRSRARRTSE